MTSSGGPRSVQTGTRADALPVPRLGGSDEGANCLFEWLWKLSVEGGNLSVS